jgi:predicted ATP-dependent serine protease
MTNVKKLSEIKATPVLRNKTWFNDLDILYGTSEIPQDHEYALNNIGMPKGKISLWAGQAGVGKSRLCIEVAKRFSTNYEGGTVLYFQTEAPLSDFASWTKNPEQYQNIFCSGEDKIDEMIKIIYQVKPKLIFIDSVNEIEEFETGNKKEARRLIKGIDGKIGLKQATHDVGAHLILLGQINQDGKTIKGGTSLPHLVDIALNVVKTNTNGVFRVEVGTKHRYGSTENTALFKHTDDGVIEYNPVPVDTPTLVQNIPAPAPVYVHPNPAQYNSKGERIIGTGYTQEEQDAYFEKKKAEGVASGRFKLDEHGEIIPKDKRSLLTKLNQGVGRMFGIE